MEACFISDVGKVRQVNEDAGGIYYNRADQMLATIADGMGGHKAGDVASQLASTYLKELWEKTEAFTSDQSICDWLEQAIIETNEHVLLHAQDNQECLGMGTTIVAAVFFDDHVVVGHVGDSRLYYISKEDITQITEDHSFVQELVKSGELTEEEAEAHPKKNVLLRAVGTDKNLSVDINKFDFKPESYVLLCTDGLSNKLTTSELFDTVHKEVDLKIKTNELIDLANKRGGEDNISVILVQCSTKQHTDEAGETS